MGYSIGEVAKATGMPASTLRYYDKEGLLPSLERKGGRRIFDEESIRALHVIECLKKSGLEIREIRQFMALTTQGSETYAVRKELMEEQRCKTLEQIEELQRTLALLEYKCWYYNEALRRGDEDFAQAAPTNLPEEAKELYRKAFPQD